MYTDVNIEELYAALDLDSLTCLGPGDNQQSCHLDTGRCHLDQLSHAVWVGGGGGTTPATSPGIILIAVSRYWCIRALRGEIFFIEHDFQFIRFWKHVSNQWN